MKSVTGMAAQFTEVTLEDMTKFMTRGWHALHPRRSVERGELVFDLFFTKNTGVRVWTSIAGTGDSGAGKGEDAIRVQLYSFAKNRPLMPGKAPIVKRTQNWRDSLQDKIEACQEAYDEVEDRVERGEFIDWTKIKQDI